MFSQSTSDTASASEDLTSGYGTRLIGHWTFESGFEASTGGDFVLFQQAFRGERIEPELGTPGSFNLPETTPAGQRILKVPACQPGMGFKATMAPHPEATAERPQKGFINQFTIAFHMLYPEAVNGTWRSLLDTTVPHRGDFYNNSNQNIKYQSDADLFINEDNGIGIVGSYHGQVPTDQWTWLIFRITNSDQRCLIEKFIDGTQVGEQQLLPSISIQSPVAALVTTPPPTGHPIVPPESRVALNHCYP